MLVPQANENIDFEQRRCPLDANMRQIRRGILLVRIEQKLIESADLLARGAWRNAVCANQLFRD